MNKTILSLALALICAQAFATGSGSGYGGGGSGSGGTGAPSSSTSGSSADVGVRLGDVIAESGDSSAGASVNGVSAQSGDSVASAKSGDSLSSAKSGDSNSKAIVGDTKATGGKSDSKAIVGDTKATGGKSVSGSKAAATNGSVTGSTNATLIGGPSTSSSATGPIRLDPSQYVTSSPTSNSSSTSGPSSSFSGGGTSSSATGPISLSPSQYSTQNSSTGASTSSTGAINNSSGGGEGGDSAATSSSAGGQGGSGGKIEQNTKYFNVTFPDGAQAAPIAAGNCGASFAVGVGWNAVTWAGTDSNSSAVCRVMPQIVALYNQCQFATGHKVLHEITRATLLDATSGWFKKGTDIGAYVEVTGAKNYAECDKGVPQTTRVYSEAELAAALAMGAKPTNVTIYNDGRAQAEGGFAKAEANDTREEAAGQCQQTGHISAIIAGKPYKAPAKTGGCGDKAKK